MNAPPEMRSPAPALASGLDRAVSVRSNSVVDITKLESPEAFAVAFVAQRYRLTPPLARLVCSLAQIGRGFA